MDSKTVKPSCLTLGELENVISKKKVEYPFNTPQGNIYLIKNTVKTVIL